jgi:hypothetical protein
MTAATGRLAQERTLAKVRLGVDSGCWAATGNSRPLLDPQQADIPAASLTLRVIDTKPFHAQCLACNRLPYWHLPGQSNGYYLRNLIDGVD